MFSRKVEHNFTVEQLKGIIRELTRQLGVLEQEGNNKEIRAKMLDISHYNSMLIPMISWQEYVAFDEELSNIRG